MNRGMNLNKTMATIRSIVALDFETTGIPSSSNMAKITELALAACEREHCQQERELPRILHKLVLPVNPMKKISFGAYNVSGLSNDMLENSKTFDNNLIELIKNFLERLPQPVCIIAHNGNKFDFPILRKELSLCSVVLPDNIYCADSLNAFREIFPKKGRIASTFGTAEEDALCIEALEKLEKTLEVGDSPPRHPMQLINETTPEGKTNPRNYLSHKNSELNNSGVCRKLILDETENKVATGSNVNVKKSGFPTTYRLQDVYRFLHDGNSFPDAHRAENDTIALLSCIVKCKNQFLDWIDRNAVLLTEIPY